MSSISFRRRRQGRQSLYPRILGWWRRRIRGQPHGVKRQLQRLSSPSLIEAITPRVFLFQVSYTAGTDGFSLPISNVKQRDIEGHFGARTVEL